MCCDAGRPRTHTLQWWAGASGCHSTGRMVQRRAGCWEMERSPKQDERGSCVSGFVLCCAYDQRLQPYLGHPPTHCRDQIQSATTRNYIKYDPKIPSKTWGFETSGGSLPPPSAFSQSEQKKHYRTTEFLCRHPVAL